MGLWKATVTSSKKSVGQGVDYLVMEEEDIPDLSGRRKELTAVSYQPGRPASKPPAIHPHTIVGAIGRKIDQL